MTTVDEYLAQLPTRQREALEALRQTIRSVVPAVEEVIRVGVPAFRYHNRPLVSIGAAKAHLSLYIMYGKVIPAHRDELEEFDIGDTVIRFQPDRPIPAEQVARLLKARIAEIHASGEKTG
jgi:uncharacterized protein YdhG (YjbR/CyaY superfamily)